MPPFFSQFLKDVALAASAFAQGGNEAHTITMDRGFFGTDYTVDGKESNVDEVENLLLDVPEASEMWSSGNTYCYVSWGMAFVGGFGTPDETSLNIRLVPTVNGVGLAFNF